MDSTQSTESPKPIITVEIRTHGTTTPEIKDERKKSSRYLFLEEKTSGKTHHLVSNKISPNRQNIAHRTNFEKLS